MNLIQILIEILAIIFYILKIISNLIVTILYTILLHIILLILTLIILDIIKLVYAFIKLLILCWPYFFVVKTSAPHEKCSCGMKSKKYLLDSPTYKAWSQKHNYYLEQNPEWNLTCFCGEEKLNK
jgi:uncharacterized membrane protein